MNGSEIPASVKSPLSLQADYANPKLYGWASVVVGVVALLVGITVLFVSTNPSPPAMIVALGAALLVLGAWVVKRGE